LLIDKRVTDLLAGFERIREVDVHLLKQWRHALLVAYARQREQYAADYRDYRRHIKDRSKTAFRGIGLCLILIIIGVILGKSALCFSALSMLCGSVVIGVLLLSLAWKALKDKPKPPPHPLHLPLKRQLLPELYSEWLTYLTGKFTGDQTKYGTVGERALVQALERTVGNRAFILNNLQQRHGNDVDVVVVGSKGIWVFEVKYWSGTITWRNGEWSREQSYHESGGQLVTKSVDVGEPPEEQWARMAQDVAETLRRRDRLLVGGFPSLLDIKGGVTFTHPSATYRIPRDTPFRWGDINGWKRDLSQAPFIPGMNQHVALRVIDTLLKRHREISDDKTTRSMDDVIDQLVQQTEGRLRAWINASLSRNG